MKSTTGKSARERILEAAVLKFSRQSYEAIGLRDIAIEANVDVAYVHRSFGSKERLFAAALKRAIEQDNVLQGLGADPAAALARHIFSDTQVTSANDVRTMDIFIHSLSSTQAKTVLRAMTIEDFIMPLSERIEGIDILQSTLIAALLVGIGIFRTVIEVPILQEHNGEHAEMRTSHAIDLIINAAHHTRDSR